MPDQSTFRDSPLRRLLGTRSSYLAVSILSRRSRKWAAAAATAIIMACPPQVESLAGSAALAHPQSKDLLMQSEAQLFGPRSVEVLSKEIARKGRQQIELYEERASAYWQTGELDKAIADYSHVLNMRPNDSTARRNRGHVYYALRDYPRVLFDFNYLINHSLSASYDAQLGRVAIYLHQGKIDLAAHDLAELDAFKGNLNPRVRFLVASFKSFKNDRKGAQEILEDLLERFENEHSDWQTRDVEAAMRHLAAGRPLLLMIHYSKRGHTNG